MNWKDGRGAYRKSKVFLVGSGGGGASPSETTKARGATGTASREPSWNSVERDQCLAVRCSSLALPLRGAADGTGSAPPAPLRKSRTSYIDYPPPPLPSGSPFPKH